MTTEYVGKVKLDLAKYPGEDFYCDGDIENDLLDIVTNHAPSEFERIIAERESWPILYHLSPLRGNIVEWLPMDGNTKVLEIGSGCGAITSALAPKCGELTCVDLSKKRSLVNANRNKEYDNITIHIGNFKDIEPELPCDYDYVCLIGVFEYGQAYIGGDNAYEDFFNIIKKHCKNDGRVVIAIENKFGLKYWAGCREDHAGLFFEGLEGYPNGGGVRTFTRNGLETILKNCGEDNYHFYYPYPDYKFMHTIFSDDRLPSKGELATNIRNFDRDRMKLFDETLVFNSVIEENKFSLFSNSYMVVTGPKPDMIFARYSNERADEFAIKTVIEECGEKKSVKKVALSKSAVAHVDALKDNYDRLTKRFDGENLKINPVSVQDGAAEFEYETGTNLEEILDSCIVSNDEEKFKTYILRYKKYLEYGEGISDYDFIFQNIIVDGDDWKLIDYEWVDENASSKDIAYRAWFCFGEGSEKRKSFLKEWYFELFGITEEDVDAFSANEAAYQKKVTGGKVALCEMRERIGCEIISPMEGQRASVSGEGIKQAVQIYPDTGSGFAEDTSFFVRRASVKRPYEGGLEFECELPENCKSVRIDPSMFACMVTIRELCIDGVAIKAGKISSNGKKVAANTYVFATEDPGFTVKVKPSSGKKMLTAKLDLVKMSASIAERV